MAGLETAPNLDSNDCGVPRRARLERGMSRYCCLQLLADDFNDLFALYHGMYHGFMIAFIVMCVFWCVRTSGFMAALLAYLGLWSFLTQFQFMNSYAEVNRGSQDVLLKLRACWHSRGGRRGSRRTLLIGMKLSSLKELRIKGGTSAFYFDKQLVVTTMDVILTQSVGLLMSY